MKKIHYSSTNNKLKNLLKEEKITLPPKFFWRLLEFLAKMCTYEEEEIKIKPCLFLGYNLKLALRGVPNSCYFHITNGVRNGSDLEKKLKALVPFCNNGWTVFININGDCIEYGIIRAFTGPRGLTLSEVIFEIDDTQLPEIEYGLIEASTISKYEISIRGLRKNSLIIDFRFFNDGYKSCNYEYLADDMTSGIDHPLQKQFLYDTFIKFMPMASRRVHGTILLIVKDQYEKESNLKDGIWLEDSINIFSPALGAEDDARSGQIFYGISGLFVDMMNVDGITVIDNKGRILGFHIFLNKEIKTDRMINGGARRRAALNMLNLFNPDHLGVYFLSQDGDSFYERKYNNE